MPRRLAVIIAGVLFAAAGAAAEPSFVTVENRSGQVAKIAVPGGNPARVTPDAQKRRIEIDVTHANGVEAKAWWVANPRELCVIFVRFDGHVVIAGDKIIRWLGH